MATIDIVCILHQNQWNINLIGLLKKNDNILIQQIVRINNAEKVSESISVEKLFSLTGYDLTGSGVL